MCIPYFKMPSLFYSSVFLIVKLNIYNSLINSVLVIMITVNPSTSASNSTSAEGYEDAIYMEDYDDERNMGSKNTHQLFMNKNTDEYSILLDGEVESISNLSSLQVVNSSLTSIFQGQDSLEIDEYLAYTAVPDISSYTFPTIMQSHANGSQISSEILNETSNRKSEDQYILTTTDIMDTMEPGELYIINVSITANKSPLESIYISDKAFSKNTIDNNKVIKARFVVNPKYSSTDTSIYTTDAVNPTIVTPKVEVSTSKVWATITITPIPSTKLSVSQRSTKENQSFITLKHSRSIISSFTPEPPTAIQDLENESDSTTFNIILCTIIGTSIVILVILISGIGIFIYTKLKQHDSLNLDGVFARSFLGKPFTPSIRHGRAPSNTLQLSTIINSTN